MLYTEDFCVDFVLQGSHVGLGVQVFGPHICKHRIIYCSSKSS